MKNSTSFLNSTENMEMLVGTNLARQNHSQITSFWTRYTNLKKIPEYFEKKNELRANAMALRITGLPPATLSTPIWISLTVKSIFVSSTRKYVKPF